MDVGGVLKARITTRHQAGMLPVSIASHCRTPEYRWQCQIGIFQNHPFMFGQKFQKFSDFVRKISGISQTWRFLFGLSIWPKNSRNLLCFHLKPPSFLLTLFFCAVATASVLFSVKNTVKNPFGITKN